MRAYEVKEFKAFDLAILLLNAMILTHYMKMNEFDVAKVLQAICLYNTIILVFLLGTN